MSLEPNIEHFLSILISSNPGVSIRRLVFSSMPMVIMASSHSILSKVRASRPARTRGHRQFEMEPAVEFLSFVPPVDSEVRKLGVVPTHSHCSSRECFSPFVNPLASGSTWIGNSCFSRYPWERKFLISEQPVITPSCPDPSRGMYSGVRESPCPWVQGIYKPILSVFVRAEG